MSTTEQTGVTEETGEVQETEQPATEAENENTEEAGEEAGNEAGEESSEDDTKLAELPEWARNELSRVRKEAADRRVANRELQESLKNAKTPEEVEALTKEHTDKIAVLERQILVTGIASDFGLPKELAEVLKGDTEEELKAHAKTLAQFAPSSDEPEDLSGGLNPSGSDETFDPVAESRKARLRRY